MKPAALQSNPSSHSLLKAVVLYDEFGSGLRAKEMLERVTDQAQWEGEFDNMFWRFDVMSQPLVAREALYRAADADMVLLAAEKAGYPPDWLIEWLEIWAITRRIQDAALVAWCHGHERGVTSEGIERLRELAERYGLEWLCAEELAGGRP